jgi:L-rhamnose mutarotase
MVQLNLPDMKRLAFKMTLKPGHAAEYRKRHQRIWPELQQLLINDGVEEYYIFLDEHTNELFAFMKKNVNGPITQRSQSAVMKKWWLYMEDIMDTNQDNSPVKTDLVEIFSLW